MLVESSLFLLNKSILVLYFNNNRSPLPIFCCCRYLFTIQNKTKTQKVRKLQESLETIKYDVSSKRKSAALDGVKMSKTWLNGKKADKLTASCRSPSVCTDLLGKIDQTLDPLAVAVKESQDAFTGSEQERLALDRAYKAQEQAADYLTQLEEQMVPENYVTPVPDEYSDLPQLQRRATVEMTLKKAGNAPFDINGVNFPEAKLVMVIDGYTGTILFIH